MKTNKTKKWKYYYIECMHFIQDHLIGYDFDRIGDPDMMREISEISEEEAMAIMARQDKEGRRNRR